MNDALNSFEVHYRTRDMKAIQLPDLINAYEEAMQLEKEKRSIISVIKSNDYGVGSILVKCFPFQKNVGVAESREVLLLKDIQENPDNILPLLRINPDVSFADSLIMIVARTHQEDIYTYAQSTNSALGQRIHKIDDPLVRTIARLASSNEGRMYFPFLDNLYKGKLTIEEVDKNRSDPFKYYRMLVNTEIDYASRARMGDTPMAMSALTSMLRTKAVEEFINVINGLHEEPDNVRMKIVETLSPQELYYFCVMGETEIYTSSYLKVYAAHFSANEKS